MEPAEPVVPMKDGMAQNVSVLQTITKLTEFAEHATLTQPTMAETVSATTVSTGMPTNAKDAILAAGSAQEAGLNNA